MTSIKIFRDACKEGNVDEVKRMVQEGFDMFTELGGYKQDGFHFACLRGHFEIVKFLVDKGAKVTVRICTTASHNRYLMIAQFLRSKLKHYRFFCQSYQ